MSSRLGQTGHSPPKASIDRSKSRVPSVVSLFETAQRYSSYVFSCFVGLHFVNACVIPLTAWVSTSETAVSNIDNAFTITRYIYRPGPAIENGLIFVPLLVHIVSGVILRAAKIRNLYGEGILAWHKRQVITWPHIRTLLTLGLSDIAASGYVTWIFITLHIYTVRNIPSIYAGDEDISVTIITHALQKHPVPFYTLYYALISAAVFHIVSGWHKWLGLTVTPHDKMVKNYIIIAINVLWLAALIRVGRLHIFKGALKMKYDTLYRYFWGKF